MRGYLQKLEIVKDYDHTSVMLWLPPSKEGAWIAVGRIKDWEREPVKGAIEHLTDGKIVPTDEEIDFILDRANAVIDKGTVHGRSLPAGPGFRPPRQR